jgi:hypothetical protein
MYIDQDKLYLACAAKCVNEEDAIHGARLQGDVYKRIKDGQEITARECGLLAKYLGTTPEKITTPLQNLFKF